MGVARAVGAVLAVLGPALVLASASLVTNPSPSLGKQALVFDRIVKKQAPKVVVLGASFASADIDPRTLAGRLGLPEDKVAVLPINASSAPVWYAVLKERVYGNAVKPDLVLLPVALGSALVRQPKQTQLVQLLEQMPTPDETVARRCMGGPTAARLRMFLAHRGDLRAPVLGAFRGALPRLLLGKDDRALTAASAIALGEMHGSKDPRALPGVEVEMNIDDLAEADGGDPTDGFLADIVDLAEGNGARVAVVLPPVMVASSSGQRAPADVEEKLERWAEDRHVAWIDLRDLSWDAGQYKDNRHLRPAAAKRLTDLVADALGAAAPAAGGGSEGGLLASTVVREGTPPTLEIQRIRPRGEPCEVAIAIPDYAFLGQKALDALSAQIRSPIHVFEGDRLLRPGADGKGCAGTAYHRVGIAVNRFEPEGPPLRLAWSDELPDGEGAGAKYWVYPGTSLVWSVPEPWPGGGQEASVELRVGLLGPGEGAPELAVDAQKAPLERQGGYAVARLPLRASGAWKVTVRSPEDGPFLFVDRLDLAAGDRAASLVVSEGARGLELFAPGSWSVEDPPPAPPPMKLIVKGETIFFRAPWKAFSYCTPLRVRHDGELLPELPPENRAGRTGTKHVEGWLYFDPLPGTDPKVGYEAVYDPDRRCEPLGEGVAEQIWLYPGDVLEGAIPATARAKFGAPLVRLRLAPTLASPAPEGAGLSLRLSLGDELLLDRTLAGAELQQTQELKLPRPILPEDGGALRITIRSSPELPPVLLLGSLEER